MGPYLNSVARLEQLAPAHLLTAHYPLMSGPAVARFLALDRAFVHDLARAVAETLRAEPAALSLRAITGPPTGRWGRSPLSPMSSPAPSGPIWKSWSPPARPAHP